MRGAVFLFDIDGTLLHARGAGRAAFARAFARLHGAPEACAGFSFGGMTDRAIARLGLRAAGVEPTEDRIDAVLAAYLAALHEALDAVASDFEVLPGARDVPLALAGLERVAVGVGTGNVRAGAAAKLARAGLDDVFSFGGYGCDHEERSEVLRAGALRGAARLGLAPERCDVLVVGDTVRDVLAAQALGARCVAVGTGGVDEHALRAAGAHAFLPSLGAPHALEALRSLALASAADRAP